MNGGQDTIDTGVVGGTVGESRDPKMKSRWESTLDKITRLARESETIQIPRNDQGEDDNEYTLTTVRGGIPIHIPGGMTKLQLEQFQISIRLQEIAYLLTQADSVKDDDEKQFIPPESRRRTPSPDPIYDGDGKRINTREYRYRTKLLDERNALIEEAMNKIPGYIPPEDYVKRPSKLIDKMYLPAADYPEINFIGQLLGPRGTTLKRMESASGARISIRGKGSVKEGRAKSLTDGSATQNEEEDLHCVVTADSEEKIKVAMREIEKVIEIAVSVPEKDNEHKRMQLRYLAELSGTLRGEQEIICNNCGGVGHKRFECPERTNYTMNIVCHICGGVGHMARDCKERNNPQFARGSGGGGGSGRGNRGGYNDSRGPPTFQNDRETSDYDSLTADMRRPIDSQHGFGRNDERNLTSESRNRSDRNDNYSHNYQRNDPWNNNNGGDNNSENPWDVNNTHGSNEQRGGNTEPWRDNNSWGRQGDPWDRGTTDNDQQTRGRKRRTREEDYEQDNNIKHGKKARDESNATEEEGEVSPPRGRNNVRKDQRAPWG